MRNIIGSFNGSRLDFSEIMRQQNLPVKIGENLYWDIWMMYRFALESICKESDVYSLGIDTWGADLGLIDGRGKLLFFPLSYRDPKVQSSASEVFSAISDYELYQSNGTIIEDICPFVHLNYWKKHAPEYFAKAEKIQLMANLVGFLLSGEISFDNTAASPSGMYDLRQDGWNYTLMDKLGMPDILPETDPRPDIIGKVKAPLSSGEIPIMRICGHDTASALMAVPAKNRDRTIYISSGSWVMTGCFLREPVITREAFEAGLSNENGFNGEINFLRYSNGLYIIQECARDWLNKTNWNIDYDYLEEQAFAMHFEGMIDPDSAEFTYPGNMCEKVRTYLGKVGYSGSTEKEKIYAAVLNGIAHVSANTIRDLKRILGKEFDSVYVLGGGSKSPYLCHRIKMETHLNIYAGPVEASATGNICTQLIRQGEIKNTLEAAELLNNSIIIQEY